MVTDYPALGFQYQVELAHVPDVSQEFAAIQENLNTNSLIIISTLKIEAAHFYKMLSTQPTATWHKKPQQSNHLVTLNDKVPLMLQHPGSDTIMVLL